METLKEKLAYAAGHPEEAAAMDASIRTNKRSVAARALVNAVKATRARDPTLSQDAIATELADQVKEFPKLFAMMFDSRYSEAMLNAMLAQLEAVEQGQKTTHDASVHVGTRLVNQYVRPQLGMSQVPLPK